MPLHFGYVNGALLDCRFDRNRVARCAEIPSESQRNSGTDTGEFSVDRLDGRRPETRPFTSTPRDNGGSRRDWLPPSSIGIRPGQRLITTDPRRVPRQPNALVACARLQRWVERSPLQERGWAIVGVACGFPALGRGWRYLPGEPRFPGSPRAFWHESGTTRGPCHRSSMRTTGTMGR